VDRTFSELVEKWR